MKCEEENQRRLGRLSVAYYNLLQSRILEAQDLYMAICEPSYKHGTGDEGVGDLRRDALADHLTHFTAISQLTASVNLNSLFWRAGKTTVVSGKHSMANLDHCFRTLLKWTVSN